MPISVRADEADEARRIIDSHRTELTSGQLVRLRDEFETLQQAIDYRFRDRGLLEHAMTHTSRANEDVSGGVVDNESLEFLGDAVLGFVIADLLFREFPAFNEGQKSKIKAALVSTATLARQAERLRLGDHLLLGRGEEKTGGRRKQALLADGYEALIAAIYLDGGIEQARAFIAREFAPLVAEVRERRPAPARITSRRCRSTCSRAISRCPSTGWPARSVPITASCFRWRWWCAARCSRKAAGRARRKRSRRRRGAALEKLKELGIRNSPNSRFEFLILDSIVPIMRSLRSSSRRAAEPSPVAGSGGAAAGAAARSGAPRARRRLRSARSRGSAAAPRRAAADRCSCSASAAR